MVLKSGGEFGCDPLRGYRISKDSKLQFLTGVYVQVHATCGQRLLGYATRKRGVMQDF